MPFKHPGDPDPTVHTCHCGRSVPEAELRYPIEWNTCIRIDQCKQPGYRADEPPWPGMEGDDDDDNDPSPIVPIRPVEPAGV